MRKYDPLLLDILERKRSSRSKSEKRFVRQVIDTVPGMQRDGFGNRWIRVGDSETMIACHTDTVHKTGGKQKLAAWRGELIPLSNNAECLGADDGAGVYTALKMIEAKVPALYVFHRQEEIGGNGSQWIADSNPEFLKGIKRCISLDRRGSTDIITHQFMGRTASDEFAVALAELLGMGHKPSDKGLFTDSANYVALIPECTNLAIGYNNEHSSLESLDVDYLDRLIDRLCKVDLESLLTVREPMGAWSRYFSDDDPFRDNQRHYEYLREMGFEDGSTTQAELTSADKLLLEYDGPFWPNL